MTDPLTRTVAVGLDAAMPDAVRALGRELAEQAGAVAALFYGSILRTGDLDGVIDFYLLTDRAPVEKIWPRVSYHESVAGGRTLRAKVATMPMATFARAASGETVDTTIWTRFVQPCALAWVADEASAQAVTRAVADAVATAATFAAALGPAEGRPAEYWRALFRATYAAEFRVEAGGREEQIVAHDPARYAAILPLGWTRAGIAHTSHEGVLAPMLSPARRRAILSRWKWRQRAGNRSTSRGWSRPPSRSTAPPATARGRSSGIPACPSR